MYFLGQIHKFRFVLSPTPISLFELKCNSSSSVDTRNPNPEDEEYSAKRRQMRSAHNSLSPSSPLGRNLLLPRTFCSVKPSPPGRFEYHEETESSVNDQIQAEMVAAYVYLAMAAFFGRTEVALPGAHGLFRTFFEEEIGHTNLFIDYQNLRGGHVRLEPIPQPPKQEWQSISDALCDALSMEKHVKKKLEGVNSVAEKHHDLTLMDMLTTECLPDQDRAICELARLLTRSHRLSESEVGTYLLDRELFDALAKKPKHYK